MSSWRRIDSRRVQRCGIFDLDHVRFEPDDDRSSDWFYVIDAPTWVNVIPLTADDRVLLVRQYRFGIEEMTLEIPGGMCDPGETPRDAALRELREETGYSARELVDLGWVHPNPPIQNNRCYTFLARGVEPAGEIQPDRHESLELESVPVDEIPQLIREGRITHALVLSAWQLWDAHRNA